MKGDFSRQTLTNAKRQQYRAVFMQQGRVQLDADWNEQQAIHLYHHETAVADVVGGAGAPAQGAGFEITSPDGQSLLIGAGRYYVNGALCTNDVSVPYDQQLYLPEPPTPAVVLADTPVGLAYLDVWQRPVSALDDPRLREVALGGPTTTVREQTVWQARILPLTSQRSDLDQLKELLQRQSELRRRLVALVVTGTAETELGQIIEQVEEQLHRLEEQGRLAGSRPRHHTVIEALREVVGEVRRIRESLQDHRGQMIERAEAHAALERAEHILTQLDHQVNGMNHLLQRLLHDDEDRESIGAARHVRTALEEAQGALRRAVQDPEQPGLEVGGAAELQTELTRMGHTIAQHAAAISGSQLEEWDALAVSSTGTLDARLEPPNSPGAEGQVGNQLYRVEIHGPGQASGESIFKWSRDNGAVVTAIQGISGPHVTVHDIGPDTALGFAAGQWAEVVQDRTELNGQPGPLAQIREVDPVSKVITLDTSLETVSAYDSQTYHYQLRRWDGTGTVASEAAEDAWIPLENGIQVTFSDGSYQPGDYWQIPARAPVDGAPGTIEWPPYPVLDGESSAQAATSVDHSHARLALIALADNALLSLADARTVFQPVTEPAPALHVTRVTLGSGGLLHNDSEVAISGFETGINLECDADVDPHSIQQATCFVTLDLPSNLPFLDASPDRAATASGNAVFGFMPYVLAGQPQVQGSTIQWRLAPATAQSLLEALATLLARQAPDQRILARLTLKGSFIWSQPDPSRYLDGETFGGWLATAGDIALRLPSGDGKPGGDFQMWFWLTPLQIEAVTVHTARVAGHDTESCQVRLNGPAPSNGATISLTSDNQAVKPDPTTVTVAAGQTSAYFDLNFEPVQSVTDVTITASYLGLGKTATIRIEPLLKVSRVQILATGFSPDTSRPEEHFEIDTEKLGAQPISVPLRAPNAVEVRFEGAPLDVSSVVAGETFIVEAVHGSEPRVIPGQIVEMSRDTVRWVALPEGISRMLVESIAESMPEGASRSALEEAAQTMPQSVANALPEGVYRIVLKGDGLPAIISEQGRRLDGDPLGFPSGNNTEGGDFRFEIRTHFEAHHFFPFGQRDRGGS